MTANNKTHLDIIIPSYDRERLIPGLVSALLPQCLENDHIIIVRQGLNNEPCPEIPSEKVFTVTLSRPNLPAARNHGLASSRAGVVLFLDDDVVPAPGLVEAHRACYDAPGISGVAGYVDDPAFDRARALPSFVDLSSGDLFQNFACAESRECVSAMGANMSFRRSALDGVHGFDEGYKHNALWEDVDCCLRLIASGHALAYCAEAKVTHLCEQHGGCRDSLKNRYLYHRFANTTRFALRFATPNHYGAWFTKMKHDLEYLSRKSGAGRDIPAVLSGVAGIAGGTLRSLFAGSRRHSMSAAEKETLRKTLVRLGSKG